MRRGRAIAETKCEASCCDYQALIPLHDALKSMLLPEQRPGEMGFHHEQLICTVVTVANLDPKNGPALPAQGADFV